jgi:hypothetical protein
MDNYQMAKSLFKAFSPRPEVAREGIGLPAPAFQIRLGSEPSGLESVDMMDS